MLVSMEEILKNPMFSQAPGDGGRKRAEPENQACQRL